MVLAFLVVVPAVVGAGMLVFGRRTNRFAAGAGVLVAVVVLALAIAAALTRPQVEVPALNGIPAGLAVDGLSAVAVVTVAAIFLAVMVFSVGDIRAGEARARFFGTMLLFVAAMFVTVTATNVFVLLAAWEVMGATSYALIGFWWRDGDRVRSGAIAFITTRTADLGMYAAAGAALAGGATGLNLSQLAGIDGGWRDMALAGLALAALGKSAQLPFSFWLARAMAGPSPVSALLHSATMVAAGGYILLRIEPGIAATGWLGPVVAWIGALTALALGAVAVVQRDLKQLLAASTASQIGFIVAAAGVGVLSGGLGQFVAHAATKSLLFLVAGAWLTMLGTKDLLRLRGAARTHPVAGITFTVGALALGGVPPLSIWFAKDEILSGTLSVSVPLYIVTLAAAAMSAAYAAKALVIVWTSPTSTARTATTTNAGRIPIAELLPLPVLAAAAAGLGVFALPPLAESWQSLLGNPVPSAPAAWELALSAVLAVAVFVAMGWLQWRRLIRSDTLISGPGWLQDWLGLEKATNAVIVRPTMALAQSCARFDDRVIARGIELAGAGVVQFSLWVEARIERGFDDAVSGIAGSARKLAVSARRPQTGMVHQYYAQAIVILVAFAVVLVLVR
jgi:NADH-quinone oxidoreductase subunit L